MHYDATERHTSDETSPESWHHPCVAPNGMPYSLRSSPFIMVAQWVSCEVRPPAARYQSFCETRRRLLKLLYARAVSLAEWFRLHLNLVLTLNAILIVSKLSLQLQPPKYHLVDLSDRWPQGL